MEETTNTVENTEETPLTFDEILSDKEYQREFDKRVAKAIETSRSKWEKDYQTKLEVERTEAEKLAKMKDEERFQYEISKSNKERDDAIAKLNAYELKETALKIAQEKGLDISLLEDIDYSKQNAESISNIIDTKKKVFDIAIEKALNEKLKQSSPTTSMVETPVKKNVSRSSF